MTLEHKITFTGTFDEGDEMTPGFFHHCNSDDPLSGLERDCMSFDLLSWEWDMEHGKRYRITIKVESV